MPESVSFDPDLPASPRARRLRIVARVLTGFVAAATAAALLMAPAPSRLVAAVVSVAALLLLARRTSPQPGGRRVSIDGDGGVRLILRDGTAAAASMLYFGTSHVCLRTPVGPLPVWSDAVPAATWRQLRVACRWPHEVDSAAAAEGLIGPRSDRTK